MAEKPTYEELEKRVQALKTDYTRLEKKLHEAELFSEEIMTYMSEGLVQTDLRGNIIFINQRLSEMLGYLPEQIIGKCWLDMVTAEQQTIAEEAEARRIKGHTDRYEIILRRKDGHKVPVMIGAGPRFDRQSGEFIGTMGVVSDITDQKKAEKQIAEALSWYQEIFEGSKDAIFISDENARFVSINSAACNLTGYDREDLRTMRIPDLHDKMDLDAFNTFHARIIGGDHVDSEARILRRDGRKVDAEFNNKRITVLGKHYMHTTARDITKRKLTEEALRESEARFRSIYEHMAVGLAQVSLDFKIMSANDAYCNMLGYREKDLVGRHLKEITHPDVIEENIQKQANLASGIIDHYRMEKKFIHKNGQTVHAILDANLIRDFSGKAIYFLGSVVDITERKQAEEVLESNFALLQIAGETAIFGGWSVDLENNICTWSDAVADIHDVPRGYSPPVQEAIKFYAPEWRGKITQIFSACAKDGIPYDEEMEIITQKGKRIWVRATGKAVKNESGKIIKVQGSFQDITEQKRTVEALRKDRERMDQILRATQTNINTIDSEYNLRRVDAIWQKIYGDPQGQKCYKYFMDLDKRCKGCGVPKALATREIVVTEEFLPKENRHIEVHTIPFQDETGEWLVTEFNINITERKQVEAEKEKLQDQLAQALKMESVGRLAGGVAHDFNNMLGVILGHTELALLKTDEDNDLVSDLNEIQKAAKRSADITKQLLAFARKQTISPRQLDLNDTVEKMLTMLRRLIGEDIDLVWQPGAHLWPVKMDPTQIDQILANLCVNARDAISGVGKLTIETGKKTFDEAYCNDHPGFIPGDFVLLAVSDNGSGMDKETLANLFEPFFTTKEVGKGTGLGLATIYGIVKQNNGFINVYSEPGQGSTFKIYLPRLVAEKEVNKAVPEKKVAAGGAETILLVEDEPTILRMTRMMLERKGYSVLSAASPAEAVEKAKNHSGAIDLFMTDVVMPEMNGRDLAGQITDLYPDIRLLFMSGYTSNVIAHHGVLDDGVAFIQKPFSMADMTAKVREVLDKASNETQ